MAFNDTNNRVKYPSKNYRIYLYDSPPLNRESNQQADYLGELEGWSSFQINSEINTLNNSAIITFNPQLKQDEKQTEVYALGDGEGDFLTANHGKLLEVNSLTTNPLNTQSFLDSRIDYGVFVRIENTDLTANRTRTLFHGVVISWQQDLASQRVIVRLEGMSSLAGRELVADHIFAETPPEVEVNAFDPDTTPAEPNVINLRVDGERITPSKYDNFLLIGADISALRIIDWLFYRNDFCQLDTNITDNVADNANSFTASNTTINDIYRAGGNETGLTPLVITRINDKNINSMLTEVWGYVSPDWFFAVEYDNSELPLIAGRYAVNRYRPRLILKRGAVWQGTEDDPKEARYVPDYTLRAGVHIVSQSLNFSGENHYTRTIIANRPAGQLRITSLGIPDSPNPITLQHAPEDKQWQETDTEQNQTDAEGRILQADGVNLTEIVRQRRITASSQYAPRVISEFPNGEDSIAGIPYTQQLDAQIINKDNNVAKFNYIKTRPIITDQVGVRSLTELERLREDRNQTITNARAEIDRIRTAQPEPEEPEETTTDQPPTEPVRPTTPNIVPEPEEPPVRPQVPEVPVEPPTPPPTTPVPPQPPTPPVLPPVQPPAPQPEPEPEPPITPPPPPAPPTPTPNANANLIAQLRSQLNRAKANLRVANNNVAVYTRNINYHTRLRDNYEGIREQLALLYTRVPTFAFRTTTYTITGTLTSLRLTIIIGTALGDAFRLIDRHVANAIRFKNQAQADINRNTRLRTATRGRITSYNNTISSLETRIRNLGGTP